MKLKIAPRERKLIIGGGIAAVIILAVQFGILPFIDYRQNARKEIEDKKTTYRKYLQTIAEKETLQAKKEDLNRRMEKANARLLNETGPTASRQLQDIAEGLLKTVEIQGKRPKDERLKDNYQRVSVQIDFQCQVDQLVPVLYEIKNYDKCFLSLDELNIVHQPMYAVKLKDSKTKPLRVTLTLSTITRYVPPEKEKKDEKDSGRGKIASAVKAWGG